MFHYSAAIEESARLELFNMFGTDLSSPFFIFIFKNRAYQSRDNIYKGQFYKSEFSCNFKLIRIICQTKNLNLK